MAGFLDAITAAANPLVGVATGQQQGQANANQINTGNLMDQVKLYQQQAAAQLAKQTQQANLGKISADTREADARANALGIPKPAEYDIQKDPVSGDVYRIDKNSGRATRITLDEQNQQGTSPPPSGSPSANPLTGGTFPGSLKLGVAPKEPIIGSPEWKAAEQYKAGIAYHAPPPLERVEGPNGPTFMTREQALGQKPSVAGAQQSGSAQAQQARMMAAVSEARLADQRMRAYEDGLLNGTTKIGPLQQAGGTLMTNLSGSHSPIGALTQPGSEAALNATSPEYAQYLRDAATIGRAEQMMSPRGGNETMVRANALLSRAGTGAMANTINASRQARQALFGASGGIEQTLTPQQSQKLQAGVQSIQRGETGKGPNTASKSMSPAAYQSAKSHGYTDKEITDQGYVIPKPEDE